MKFKECYRCKNYAEASDTENINGKYYCYHCFGFCQECSRPVPYGEDTNDEELMCTRCSTNSKIDE